MMKKSIGIIGVGVIGKQFTQKIIEAELQRKGKKAPAVRMNC